MSTASERSGQPSSAQSISGRCRILVLGRTGSGKTTLARELAAELGVPHIELDALYFGPQFSTAPLSVLRERVCAAVSADRWVTDGNKSAVRDLVWPRADTIVWLDYPLVVSLWRLGRRALWRASAIKTDTHTEVGTSSRRRQMMSAAKGVLTALVHIGANGAPTLRCSPRNKIGTSRSFDCDPHEQLVAGTPALYDTQASGQMETVDSRQSRPTT